MTSAVARAEPISHFIRSSQHQESRRERSPNPLSLHMGYGIPFKTPHFRRVNMAYHCGGEFIVSGPRQVNLHPKLARVAAGVAHPADPLAIAGSRRVFDEVYVRLRSAIIKGHFAAGERFVERTLTERLQVSRTPIREAIKRLEQEGLVVCYPHRGCFVRNPSYDEAGKPTKCAESRKESPVNWPRLAPPMPNSRRYMSS